MKLYNNKTGLVIDTEIADIKFKSEKIIIIPEPIKLNGLRYSYESLSKLKEEWEDYKPTEPLIKDEKIRKFVREWTTFNKIENAYIKRTEDNDSWFKIYGQDEAMCYWMIEIHAPYSKTVGKDYKGDSMTITELCGKEE